MKVIQLLPELNSGGVERGTLDVSNHLGRLGHESVVLSNGGRMVELVHAGGGRSIQLPIHLKRPSALLLIPQLRRIFRDERPDLVHARSRLPAWLTWLAWSGLDRRTRPRFLTTFHGFYSVNAYSRIMTRGERVIAVSESIRDFMMRRFRLPSERIVVIHRGVDPEQFRRGYSPSSDWLAKWRAEHPYLEGEHLLLLPGRLTRMKGQEDLVDLIASLRRRGIPAHGMMVGEIVEAKRRFVDELKQRARDRGVGEFIHLTGHRTDVRDIMSVSRIVLSLSRDPEAFGRVSLEALSLGRPVIATDHGGVAEQMRLIEPRGLVPCGSPEELLRRTIEFLESPPSPGPIPAQFTLSHMLDSTMGVYDSLMRAGR